MYVFGSQLCAWLVIFLNSLLKFQRIHKNWCKSADMQQIRLQCYWFSERMHTLHHSNCSLIRSDKQRETNAYITTLKGLGGWMMDQWINGLTGGNGG